MSIPMQWSANVKLPYYGWFGREGFSTQAEARKYVADQLRSVRHHEHAMCRPTYASRQYVIRPYAMLSFH